MEKNMPIKNFIFDFDGTLADSGETGVLATQSAFKQLGYSEPSKSLIEYYMGVPIEESFKKMNPDYTYTEREFQTLLSTFRKLYQSIEQENMTTFPNIPLVLSKLHQHQKKIFVVSSKHSTPLQRNLQQLNIDQYFDGVSGSDQVEHYKPAPDGILLIERQFNLISDDTIMIGDAIFDVQMGQAAHVKTAAVTWGAHDLKMLVGSKPDYIFEQVNDILSLQ